MSPLLLEGRPLGAVEAAGVLLLLAASTHLIVRLAGRPLPAARKAALMVFRLGAAALAAVLLWSPSLSVRRKARVPVAVVLDASSSMETEDARGGLSRWASVQAALEKDGALLSREAAPSFFSIGDKLVPVKEAAGLVPAGSLSDLGSLSKLPSLLPGLKAVFLFSDGRRSPGADFAAALGARGVPLFAVGAGDPAFRPDLSVEDVRAAPFAFKDVDAEVSVRLRAAGLPPGRATLKVLSGRETLGRREVIWAASGVWEGTVTFRPRRTGLQTFSVSAEPLAVESNVKNNAAPFTVDVSRDRKRVLYICGRPGPHYAFLRHLIKGDPKAELVSFVILRDPEDFLDVSERELSLIPFPSQDQLLDGLSEFDAVIFEDFSFAQFRIGEAGLAALRRFVEKGGGLLLAADPEMFGLLSPYRGTSLEPLIPFRLDGLSAGPARFRAEPLSPDHPLTASLDAALWRRLPVLEGPGLFPAALRPGAVPLLGAEGGPAWAAALSVGRGRVLGLANLTTWRWSLGRAAEGPAAYAAFWGNVLSWLSGGEAAQKLRLGLPAEGASVGEEAWLRAWVRDESGRPAPDADVEVEALFAGGARRSVRLDPTGEGEYGGALPVDAPGPILLSARARRRGLPWGEASALLRAGSGWEESRDVSPDFASLEEAARATGGAFVPLERLSGDWIEKALEQVSWETERRIPLGEGAATVFLLLALLLSEWIFRRWKGHP